MKSLSGAPPFLVAGARGRSRTVTGDVRRIADMLREPEPGGVGAPLPADACGLGGYLCSGGDDGGLPAVWDSGDRGGPLGVVGLRGGLRASPQQQLDSLAEHFEVCVAGLKRQYDAEKRAADRRFQQLERQFQGIAGRVEGDSLRDGDWREKWAELQGSLNGLMEETQALARRVEGLDDRIYSRANGAEELARQSAREMQQQLQIVERQVRLAGAATEEANRRQLAKQRRTDQLLEDFAWRLQKSEDEHRAKLDENPQRESQVKQHIGALEEHVQGLCTEVRSVGGRLEAVEAQWSKASELSRAPPLEPAMSEETAEIPELRKTMDALESKLSAFEARVSKQHEEICTTVASVRVKVEGQLQRQSAIAERFETTNTRSIEALRTEFGGERARDLRNVEGWIAELNQKVKLALETVDSNGVAAHVDGLTRRVSSNESQTGALRREIQELQTELRSSLGRGGRVSGLQAGANSIGSSALPALLATPTIQDQLGAVADQLEALDELATHVTQLITRVSDLETQALAGALASSARRAPTIQCDAKARTSSQDQAKHTLAAAADCNDFPTSSTAPCLQTKERPPLPRGDRPSVVLGAVTLQETLHEHWEAPMTRSRSRESTMSCDIFVGLDEEVSGPHELHNKCDCFLEVLQPPRHAGAGAGGDWKPNEGPSVAMSAADQAVGRVTRSSSGYVSEVINEEDAEELLSD